MIRERTLAARLERFRRRTADLKPAIALGSYGVGHHVIREEGSNLERIVPSMQGRETWAPGSKVTIATHAGKSGPAIIGKAPAGQQGGSGFALRRYPPGPAPVDSDAPSFFVLFEDPAFGSHLAMARYAATGAWEADIANLALPGSSVYANGAQLIRTDPSETVADNSVLLVPTYGEVMVWDVEAGVAHRIDPLDSHGNPAGLWPFWHDGYVYWAQFDHVTGSADYTYTLFRATANLASPTALGSITGTLPDPDAAVSNATSFAGRAASNGYYARAQLSCTDNPAVDEVVFFPWSGTGGTSTPGLGWAQTSNCTGIERPGVAGVSLVALDPTDPPGLGSPLSTIDATSATTSPWPAVIPAYTGDGQPTGNTIALDALQDGTALALARVHSNAGGTVGVDDFLTFTAYYGDPSGAPTAVAIQPHPGTGALPGSVFLR